MVDRAVRSLDYLEQTASTSRVLNLRAVGRRKGRDPEYKQKPLFQNPALNTSIIVKHRIRANEAEIFTTPRPTATKIMVPIDRADLKLGARYVFVGQRRFEDSLSEAFGVEPGEASMDVKTLNILDQTPSLDPFLLREQLRRHGIEPARCYFDLSDADSNRMFDFAQREIQPLVNMSLGEAALDPSHAAKLAKKILANTGDAELEPLRLTLQLDRLQYQEGVFCWKAFLYYKWQLAELLPRVTPVMKQIETLRPRGPQSDELKAYLSQAREALQKAVVAACRAVKDTIMVYDAAYVGLTQNGRPQEFRDFLLKAPALFNDLGERLGAVEHIVSFWRFRFPSEKPTPISPEDLSDIFKDFENSLSIPGRPAGSRLAPAAIIEHAA